MRATLWAKQVKGRAERLPRVMEMGRLAHCRALGPLAHLPARSWLIVVILAAFLIFGVLRSQGR